MNEKFNDILFFRVWRNIVINKVIFKYSRLYIKNKNIVFNDKASLRLYEEREFITKLKYKDDEYIKSSASDNVLSKGDLPEYGILKELDLTFCSPISNFDAIPKSVEIVHFSYRGLSEIQLSELPSSVHTVTNAVLKKPYSDYQIPENITSLSFNFVDPKEFYDLKLPSTLTTLDIKCLKYYVNRLPDVYNILKLFSWGSTSFIPSSLTDLTTFYDEKYKSKLPVIPASVTKLQLNIGGENKECNFKGYIPFGVKDLFINGSGDCNINISKDSLPPSITKLVIYFGSISTIIYNNIKPSSIPNSVTDLNLRFDHYPSFKGINYISDSPNPPLTLSDFPLSLKHLTINGKVIDLNNKE